MKKINKEFEDKDSQLIFGKLFAELQIAEQQTVYRYQKDCNNPSWEYILIDGLITNYSISKIGQVGNNKTGLILKPDYDNAGYPYVVLYIKQENGHKYTKTVKIHRMVATAFIPNPENKPQVNHINGKKDFNWVGNLEWVTAKENIEHAFKTGLRTNYGENVNSNKYDEATIHHICELLEKGLTPTQVSRETGVPVHVATNIKNGSNWLRISGQYNIPKPINIARPKEFRDYIIELIMAGYSNTEIAQEMDLPMDNPIKSREYVGLIRRRFFKS